MNRKSPIRHKVRSHTREGKQIQSFERGKGRKSQRSRKVVAKKNPVVMQIREFLKDIPKKDRTLFNDLYIGEEHPRYGKKPGLWLAVALPGRELWLRHPPEEDDKVTILHEYGHYVWFFDTTDEQKKHIKDAYFKAQEWAKKRAKEFRGERVFYPYSSWEQYFISKRAGRDVKEAFAEAYAWYYAHPDLKGALKENLPEIYRAFVKVEKSRVGS